MSPAAPRSSSNGPSSNGSSTNEPAAAKLCGVVLVGGRSSRMGRDKASLPHPAGGTFLEHALGRLLALGCPVIVSGRQDIPPPFENEPAVTALPDPPSEREATQGGRPSKAGPAVGLAAALEYAAAFGATGILATPVDVPCLAGDHLQAMRAAYSELANSRQAGSEAPAASTLPLIGTFDGQHLEPLVAIYPLSMLASLQQLAASRDRSLTRWLASQPHRLHLLPTAAAPNVNTPAEYQQLFSPPPPPAPRPQT